MSDIDFLGNKTQSGDKEPKHKGDKGEQIVWSEPEDARQIPKSTAFSLLSFLNKKREVKKVNKPAEEPKAATIDKTRIRESRQEILKLIKDHENLEPNVRPKKTVVNEPLSARQSNSPARISAPVRKTGTGWFAGLSKIFEKKPNHKEILIDYQQVFNQEKDKRSLPVEQPMPVRPAVNPVSRVQANEPKPIQQTRMAQSPQPIRPVLSVPTAKEKKPAAVSSGSSLFSRLLQFLFGRKSPSSKPVSPVEVPARRVEQVGPLKANPTSVDLKEFIKEVKPIVVRPPQPQPVISEKQQIKTKEIPLQQTEPVQIEGRSLKSLETNLIKGEIITFFDWRRKSVTLINSILIPIFCVGLIYLGLLYYQKQSQTKNQEQAKKTNELTERINQEEAGLKEMIAFQNRLKIVSQIFAKHIYWTNFFKFLQDNTMKEVYFTGFAGDTGGNYPMSAIAGTYSDISRQVDILSSNQKITDIKTTGGELIADDAKGETGVKFDLNISISKDIFTE